MKIFAVALLTLLAACGKPPPPKSIIVTQEVLIPIVGACVPKGLGTEPVYSDTDAALKAAPEGPVRFQLLIIGRAERMARLLEIEPIILACPKEK